MISLRVSATKLVNKNEPDEIPKEFPSRRELAINYTRCWQQFFLFLKTKMKLSTNKNKIGTHKTPNINIILGILERILYCFQVRFFNYRRTN